MCISLAEEIAKSSGVHSEGRAGGSVNKNNVGIDVIAAIGT